VKPGPLARSLLDFFLPVACLGCGARLPLDRPDDLVCVNCVGRLRPVPSPRCPRCDLSFGTARSPDRPCGECAEWPPFVAGARCAVVLEAPASKLVHAFKYEGWRELASPMGERVAALVRTAPFTPPGSSSPCPPPAGVGDASRPVAASRAIVMPRMAASPDRLRDPDPVVGEFRVRRTDEPGRRLVVPVPTTARRERHRGYNQAKLLAEVVADRNGLPLVSALLRTGDSRTQVSLHAAERLANVRRAFSVQEEEASRLEGASVILVDDVLTTGATALAAAYALHSGGAERVTVLTFARALPARDPRSRTAR
jgi:predicted amidophosphoribosyltransferase